MGKILLDHGKGGAATQELLTDLFLKHLSSPVLHCLEDSALLEEHAGRLAFSTDCYINEPLFFPGGNVGSLAVFATINNLAMRGAMPLALSLGLIIEEGFSLRDLEKIIQSIGISSTIAEVAIVTGDTKVVPQGRIEGVCLNTSGIGLVSDGVDVSGANIAAQDCIIISGNIAEHGLALHCCSKPSAFYPSTVRPLHFMIQEIINSFPGALHALRDPTRGGLATSLVWLASASGVCLEIDETAIPISSASRKLCLQENLDPLYLNSQGRCILCCDSESAMDIVALMRKTETGRDAKIIGHASSSPMGRVRFYSKEGQSRFVEALD